MTHHKSLSAKLFTYFNYIFLILVAAACLLPMINVLAISFSSSTAEGAGLVKLWPVDFNLKSYQFVLNKPEFMTAFYISLKRVVVGVSVNMILTVLIAYPLSKDKRAFKA